MDLLQRLDQRFPGWRQLNRQQINQLLMRLGPLDVKFVHRAGSERGTLKFVEPSVRTKKFNWASLNISVEGYFRLWYGETLDFPDSWLVAIEGVQGLFPADMLIVV